jgi:segregation and condensation protein A
MVQVSVANFSGPFDLLLKLIEKEELDITKISLAKITDEYIEHIKASPAIRPEEMADFLVIAAKLLFIKSKALFPFLQFSADEDDNSEDLEKQLKMYKEFLEAAKKIDKIIGKKKFMFPREFNRKALLHNLQKFFPPKNLIAADLSTAFQEILGRLQRAPQLDEETIEISVSIEDKIRQIQEIIKLAANSTFSQLAGKSGSKTDIIVSFLALLELIKQKAVSVRQDELFEEIEINSYHEIETERSNNDY